MEHDSNNEIVDRDAATVAAARRAVARWSGFPATAEARPIVLLHSPVRVEGGFATSAAMNGFEAGAVEAAPGVPGAAVEYLRASGSSVVARRDGTVLVTGAVMSATEYQTDRGPLLLPAWRLEVSEALGPIWVLTEETLARCWSPPPVIGGDRFGPQMLESVTVEADDRTLHVEFIGGRDELFRYDSHGVEMDYAVTVVPLERTVRKLPPGTAMTLEGYFRCVHGILDKPLGGRVFVNLDSSPVPVKPEGRTTWREPSPDRSAPQ